MYEYNIEYFGWSATTIQFAAHPSKCYFLSTCSHKTINPEQERPWGPPGAGVPSSSTPCVSLGLTQTSVSCESVHVSLHGQSTHPLCERYISLCCSLVFHPAALTPSLQHHLPAVTAFISCLLKTTIKPLSRLSSHNRR